MSKGINFSKMADFSELEDLANRIGMAVLLDDRSSKFNREKILQAGANVLMTQIVKETPPGKNKSNWYDYTYTDGTHSAHYFLAGRSHRAGTLGRGWVMEQSENPELGAKASGAAAKRKVNITPITKSNDNLSMTFYNVAPYAAAVEWGHWVRLPYFMGPPGTPRGHGQILPNKVAPKYSTQRAIWHSEDAVKLAVKKECTKMLKSVVKGK